MTERPSPMLLGQLAFMREFLPEHLERLAELAEHVRWEADETIFRAGSHGAVLYVVREGRVAIEFSTAGRKRMTILTVGPGDVFGWSGVFANRPKAVSARAVLATEAYAFDAAGLRALCDADPRFGYAFTRRLLSAVSERLKETRMQLMDLFANPAPRAPRGEHI
ncbi:MAG: Crp/Fnr family transcriptional regulator [Isosphaeraceae bacterium]|nr:Crp/Fnr family transcriptional regulator [Isosphaeraceae bacterium]